MRKYTYPLLAAILAVIVTVVIMPTRAYSEQAVAAVPFSLKTSCGPTNSTGWCTATHNLGVVPEVIQAQTINYTAIVTTRNWTVNTVQVRLSKRVNLDGTVDNWVGITAQVSLLGMYKPATSSPSATPTTIRPSTQPTSASPSVSPSPSVTVSATPSPTVTEPPVLSDYPTATNTGVPAGTVLTPVSGNVLVTEPNTVIDGKKISGDVDIRAQGVVIKNSEIAGRVINDNVAAHPSFTIQDSQVGSTTGCSTATSGAIGTKNYTALRVKLVGYVDGFRIAGSNVLIQDSFVKLCGNNPDYHSDGIQAYGAAGGKNIVIKHNVIDQRSVISDAQTAPIFIPNDGANQGNQNIEVVVDDNVLASGGYSLRVFGDLPFSAPSVSGNKVVDGTWGYGPVDVTCAKIGKWERNATVTYDWTNGKILSQVRSLDDVC